MLKHILLFSLLALPLFSFAQATTCKDFHNGKFKIMDEDGNSTIITREGSKQIEYAENIGLKIELEIDWIDECTYTMKLKKVLENQQKIKMQKQVMTTRIVETWDDSYIQETTSNKYDFVYKSEVMRIE